MKKKDILLVTLNWSSMGGSQKRAMILDKNFSKLFTSKYISLNKYLDNQNNNQNFLSKIYSYRKLLKEYKIIVTVEKLILFLERQLNYLPDSLLVLVL